MAKILIPEFRRPVDGALYMFDKGFKVFPLKQNEKIPMVSGWQEWAVNATRKKIEDYGKANALSNWGVSCSASNTFILDIDDKPGKEGSKSLAPLLSTHGQFPDTFVVHTATKGRHIYFQGKGKNSASLIGKDLDTRGEGGYVVAPGSIIDDGSYQIISVAPMAPTPNWLTSLLQENKKKAAVLTDEELVVEGSRNNTLAMIAGTLRRAGLNHSTILAALTEANETQLQVPLPQSEV